MFMTKKEYKQWMWDNDPGYFEMMKKDEDEGIYDDIGHPMLSRMSNAELKAYEEFKEITVVDDLSFSFNKQPDLLMETANDIFNGEIVDNRDYFYGDFIGVVKYLSRTISNSFKVNKDTLKKWKDVRIKFFSITDLEFIINNKTSDIFDDTIKGDNITEIIPSMLIRKINNHDEDCLELIGNICNENHAKIQRIMTGLEKYDVENKIRKLIRSCLFGGGNKRLDYAIFVCKFE